MKFLDAIEFKESYLQITLFALLVFIIFIIPLFPERLLPYLNSTGFTLLLVVGIFTLKDGRAKAMRYGVIILLAFWITVIFDLRILNILANILKVLFFILLVIRLMIQIARSREVNVSVILESISVYLMMGLLLSYLTVITLFFFPGSLIFPEVLDPNIADITYFTFVTMSTLGYGDVLPILPITRSLSILTSISGQIYLAVIIAMLVGKYSSQRSR